MLDKNPIQMCCWKKLQDYYLNIKNFKIIDFFKKDKNRFEKFFINFKNKIFLDFSKNLIDIKVIKLFNNLLKEMEFDKFIFLMLSGEKINVTEKRSVLHIYSRDVKGGILKKYYKNNNNLVYVLNEVTLNLKKIKKFTKEIINGIWLGYSNCKIKNIVNIGIGGSNLGPKMSVKFLSDYKNHLNIYYVSNVDVIDIKNILSKISPKNTLFIICSKTFTTLETMSNADIARDWVLNYYKNNLMSLKKHFIAVSNNFKKVYLFGIDKNNIFFIPEWIGGRYSLFSSVGLSLSLSIGYKNFSLLLKGAHDMDKHFLNNNIYNNIPIILAIISIWYNNFFNYNNELVLVYNKYMSLFPLYLQQLVMESNGKYIDRGGNLIKEYNTSSVLFGGVGTDCQHSFFQLLHQGTQIIPCDFIGEIVNIKNNINKSHYKLISNLFAQSHALAFGDEYCNYFRHDSCEYDILNKYKYFKGNRPNNILLIKNITPYSLGSIISLYEHKVFIQGFILNIFSFDQWGVELGKKISNNIYYYLNNSNVLNKNIFDKSTMNLIKIFNNFNFKKK